MLIINLVAALALSMDEQSTPSYLQLYRNNTLKQGSKQALCFEKQAARGRNLTTSPNEWFETIGVEGVGHHLLMSMPKVLCNKPATWCGSKFSYPYGNKWRTHPNEEANASNFKIHTDKCASKKGKRVFLLRDPVDSFLSSINRFWLPRQEKDSLAHELLVEYGHWKVVDNCFKRTVCDENILILSFELFTRHVHKHKERMAAFLGVHQNNTALLTWMKSLTQSKHTHHEHFAVVGKLCVQMNVWNATGMKGNGPKIPTDKGIEFEL